jgi:hypothetical protein
MVIVRGHAAGRYCLKPGLFYSLLMGVQAAFGSRGRVTVSLNYRIVSKFGFVHVISLVLTSLLRSGAVWVAKNTITLSHISWAVGTECETS